MTLISESGDEYCEICGSTQLDCDDEYCFCWNCGHKTERAKKEGEEE